MKKKLLAKGQKKLAKSQKKLKKALKGLGQSGKKAENPAWVTALVAMASAVTTALTDREKRGRLADIATEAKDKAVGLLTGEGEEEVGAVAPHEEELHLESGANATETRAHV